MRRRDFMTLVGGFAAGWPIAASAQSVRRIGVLMGVANDAEGQARVHALRQGLQEWGWVEGRNLRLDVRFADGDSARARTLATELLGLGPEVAVVNSSIALASMQQATRTVPIVFAQVLDPVGSGFVASLGNPGGNTTGFASFEATMAGKWIELLKELDPRINRVLVVQETENVAQPPLMRAIEDVAKLLKVEVVAAAARNAAEIEPALFAFAGAPNGALVVLTGPMSTVQRDVFIGLAARHRLPAIYGYRFYATSGGLASYGIDNLDLYRRAASYVDRILKGAKPADLPVQQPTKFELVVNLKTAKTLGLTVPESFLLRADEVIE